MVGRCGGWGWLGVVVGLGLACGDEPDAAGDTVATTGTDSNDTAQSGGSTQAGDGAADTASGGADALPSDGLLEDGLLDMAGSDDSCPPCVPPPHEACVGTGPCGCGPYACEGTFDGDPGVELATVNCPACSCTLALDATSVLVVDDVGLSRVDKSGGEPELLFSGVGAGGFAPRDLVTVGDVVVLAEDSGLTQVGTDGAPLGSLGAFDDVTAMALAGDWLLFARGGDSALYRVATDPGAMDPGVVVSGRGPAGALGAVSSDGTVTVFSSGGELYRLDDAAMPRPGATTALTDGAEAATGVGTVGVSTQSVIFVRADGAVASVARSGGTVEALADVNAKAIAVTDTTAYFPEANAIRSIAVGGGRPEVVAAFGFDTSPTVAVDDTSVYFVACGADDVATVASLRSAPR